MRWNSAGILVAGVMGLKWTPDLGPGIAEVKV